MTTHSLPSPLPHPTLGRLVIGVLLATIALVATAAVAGAHASFSGAAALPGDTDQVLTMEVPHEKGDGPFNVDVAVSLPAGWRAVSCAAQASWTCVVDQSNGQVFRFAKQAGAAPADDETFHFTVHTPASAGSGVFPTVQTYSTGDVVRWIGAAGTSNPAPILGTTAAAVTVPPATAAWSMPPTDSSTSAPSGSTSSTSSSTTSSTSTSTTAPSISSTTVPDSSGDGGDGSNIGLGLAAAAFVLVVGGAGAWVVRRRIRP
jgi:uncharacterized protein YcnI